MSPLLRNVLAVVAGLAAAVAVVAVVEGLSARVFPLPEGLDYSDRTAMAEAIGNLPAGAFVFVVAAWGLGALAGAAVATGISRRVGPGYLIGVLLLAAAVSNLLMIPHPGWMWAGGIVVILLGTMVGSRLAARQRVVTPPGA